MFGAEEEKEYMLIGMIVGLAIYNNITLDVNFPPVLFKKMLGYLAMVAILETSLILIYQKVRKLNCQYLRTT